jgi:hypothetical protein
VLYKSINVCEEETSMGIKMRSSRVYSKPM